MSNDRADLDRFAYGITWVILGPSSPSDLPSSFRFPFIVLPCMFVVRTERPSNLPLHIKTTQFNTPHLASEAHQYTTSIGHKL
jgi:hypothetical protein